MCSFFLICLQVDSHWTGAALVGRHQDVQGLSPWLLRVELDFQKAAAREITTSNIAAVVCELVRWLAGSVHGLCCSFWKALQFFQSRAFLRRCDWFFLCQIQRFDASLFVLHTHDLSMTPVLRIRMRDKAVVVTNRRSRSKHAVGNGAEEESIGPAEDPALTALRGLEAMILQDMVRRSPHLHASLLCPLLVLYLTPSLLFLDHFFANTALYLLLLACSAYVRACTA